MSNRSRSMLFRELVSLTLSEKYGLHGVSMKPPRYRRLSQALTEEQSDLRGIPGWSVNVRDEGERALAQGVDEAERDAETDGKPFAAVVWRRRESDVERAFVVMSLDSFARALKDRADAAA